MGRSDMFPLVSSSTFLVCLLVFSLHVLPNSLVFGSVIFSLDRHNLRSSSQQESTSNPWDAEEKSNNLDDNYNNFLSDYFLGRSKEDKWNDDPFSLERLLNSRDKSLPNAAIEEIDNGRDPEPVERRTTLVSRSNGRIRKRKLSALEGMPKDEGEEENVSFSPSLQHYEHDDHDGTLKRTDVTDTTGDMKRHAAKPPPRSRFTVPLSERLYHNGALDSSRISMQRKQGKNQSVKEKSSLLFPYQIPFHYVRIGNNERGRRVEKFERNNNDEVENGRAWLRRSIRTRREVDATSVAGDKSSLIETGEEAQVRNESRPLPHPHPNSNPVEVLHRLTRLLERMLRELSQFGQKFTLRLIRMTERQDIDQMQEIMKDFEISPEKPIFFIAGGLRMPNVTKTEHDSSKNANSDKDNLVPSLPNVNETVTDGNNTLPEVENPATSGDLDATMTPILRPQSDPSPENDTTSSPIELESGLAEEEAVTSPTGNLDDESESIQHSTTNEASFQEILLASPRRLKRGLKSAPKIEEFEFWPVPGRSARTENPYDEENDFDDDDHDHDDDDDDDDDDPDSNTRHHKKPEIIQINQSQVQVDERTLQLNKPKVSDLLIRPESTVHNQIGCVGEESVSKKSDSISISRKKGSNDHIMVTAADGTNISSKNSENDLQRQVVVLPSTSTSSPSLLYEHDVIQQRANQSLNLDSKVLNLKEENVESKETQKNITSSLEETAGSMQNDTISFQQRSFEISSTPLANKVIKEDKKVDQNQRRNTLEVEGGLLNSSLIFNGDVATPPQQELQPSIAEVSTLVAAQNVADSPVIQIPIGAELEAGRLDHLTPSSFDSISESADAINSEDVQRPQLYSAQDTAGMGDHYIYSDDDSVDAHSSSLPVNKEQNIYPYATPVESQIAGERRENAGDELVKESVDANIRHITGDVETRKLLGKEVQDEEEKVSLVQKITSPEESKIDAGNDEIILENLEEISKSDVGGVGNTINTISYLRQDEHPEVKGKNFDGELNERSEKPAEGLLENEKQVLEKHNIPDPLRNGNEKDDNGTASQIQTSTEILEPAIPIQIEHEQILTEPVKIVAPSQVKIEPTSPIKIEPVSPIQIEQVLPVQVKITGKVAATEPVETQAPISLGQNVDEEVNGKRENAQNREVGLDVVPDSDVKVIKTASVLTKDVSDGLQHESAQVVETIQNVAQSEAKIYPALDGHDLVPTQTLPILSPISPLESIKVEAVKQLAIEPITGSLTQEVFPLSGEIRNPVPLEETSVDAKHEQVPSSTLEIKVEAAATPLATMNLLPTNVQTEVKVETLPLISKKVEAPTKPAVVTLDQHVISEISNVEPESDSEVKTNPVPQPPVELVTKPAIANLDQPVISENPIIQTELISEVKTNPTTASIPEPSLEVVTKPAIVNLVQPIITENSNIQPDSNSEVKTNPGSVLEAPLEAITKPAIEKVHELISENNEQGEIKVGPNSGELVDQIIEPPKKTLDNKHLLKVISRDPEEVSPPVTEAESKVESVVKPLTETIAEPLLPTTPIETQETLAPSLDSHVVTTAATSAPAVSPIALTDTLVDAPLVLPSVPQTSIPDNSIIIANLPENEPDTNFGVKPINTSPHFQIPGISRPPIPDRPHPDYLALILKDVDPNPSLYFAPALGPVVVTSPPVIAGYSPDTILRKQQQLMKNFFAGFYRRAVPIQQ